MSDMIVRKGHTGEPTTNTGHFGSRERDVPVDRPLHDDPLVMVAESWEPNATDFTIPQANDLEKVALVVEAIRDGADTGDAIGEYLGYSGRTGNYYATAAGYLGFVDRRVDEFGVDTFEMTELGEMLHTQNEPDRCRLLGLLVNRLEDVETVRARGAETLAGQYALYENLSDDTAERRAACMSSWSNQSMDLAALQLTYSARRSECAGRKGDAVEVAERQRAAARRVAAAAAPRTGGVCGSCFTQMPVTGVCDNCD